MAYVFLLMFFAAIAGVVKPYINGSKRSYFAAAAVVAFILTGITAPTTPGEKTKLGAAPADAAETVATDTNTTAATHASEVPAQPTSNWEYSTSKDEMRGTSSKFAQVHSDNMVDLEFPYGEVHGALWLRQRPQDGLSVAFEVEKGQILCNDFEDSYISIKFDNGPVQKFRCSGTADGSSNIGFINDEHRLLADLKRSKRAVLEAQFYEQGPKQFTFQTAGLNWK